MGEPQLPVVRVAFVVARCRFGPAGDIAAPEAVAVVPVVVAHFEAVPADIGMLVEEAVVDVPVAVAPVAPLTVEALVVVALVVVVHGIEEPVVVAPVVGPDFEEADAVAPVVAVPATVVVDGELES